jgi:hypothetical protein
MKWPKEGKYTQRSGFSQFKNEAEFDACVSKLIEEDREVLLELGRK